MDPVPKLRVDSRPAKKSTATAKTGFYRALFHCSRICTVDPGHLYADGPISMDGLPAMHGPFPDHAGFTAILPAAPINLGIKFNSFLRRI